MKNYILIILLLAVNSTKAQYARFMTQGTIEFEKRTNSYALAKIQMKDWGEDSFSAQAFEHYQKNNPQFKVAKSKLIFNGQTTAFLPEEDVLSANPGWFGNMIELKQPNSILTSLLNGTKKIQKKVFEETYMVDDSVRKINWKITDEFRNIAGYNCRRANALVMDSIYVVAFYTEEIAVSGGPESFAGLPGMILGVALPHDHTTWFATSVTDEAIPQDKLKIPTKGKAVSNQQLTDILNKAFKSWGKSAQRNSKWLLL